MQGMSFVLLMATQLFRLSHQIIGLRYFFCKNENYNEKKNIGGRFDENSF
jgi:hypothetical protein